MGASSTRMALAASKDQKSDPPARRRRERDTEALERCRQLKGEVFEKDKKVGFLMNMMAVYGCPVTQHDFVSCDPCRQNEHSDIRQGGGFRYLSDGSAEVILCEKELKNYNHTAEILRHELIHAIDHCKYEVDWDNPKHVACTEIRAASLSGDCRWAAEVARGALGASIGPEMLAKGHHPKCVRRRAKLSLMTTGLSKLKAEQAVDAVFEDCYNDTSPFGVIPH
mmetsp:Transcript_35588/g.69132  ORF Transcript_35588/g.69132 Transcript_35588/m.69132 type:complete len:224 (+) Transcript_35588:21-692(+)